MNIDVDAWNDAISGKSGNPVGDQAITDAAEAGELSIIDKNGKRHTPSKDKNGRWNPIYP